MSPHKMPSKAVAASRTSGPAKIAHTVPKAGGLLSEFHDSHCLYCHLHCTYGLQLDDGQLVIFAGGSPIASSHLAASCTFKRRSSRHPDCRYREKNIDTGMQPQLPSGGFHIYAVLSALSLIPNVSLIHHLSLEPLSDVERPLPLRRSRVTICSSPGNVRQIPARHGVGSSSLSLAWPVTLFCWQPLLP